ncbi:dynein regulatory complex subunit 7 [Brachionichthys hirsutus]|uniref:dynein regulatory complex subunit 7 n=1 Tax=Brachionichthys hirsutus TaxID=412623 RepID=UPI0036049171
METVLELDNEEQITSGKTQEEGKEEDDLDLTAPTQALSERSTASAPQEPFLNQEASKLYPESYRLNSPGEIRLFSIAENFQRQYSYLYPDRKPLLLCPANECGVKKFVPTTLQPTPTIHPELYTWEGCASFVADFLSLEMLDPPVDLPRRLLSSASVLQSQSATSFEFATLLCSLLLAAHYDAYCVSGYAVRETCLLDQSLQECPLLGTEVKVSAKQITKYSLKAVREVKSRFLDNELKKKQDAEAALLQKHKLQESSEQRPADPLQGLRVHCWVLVLSGSRDVRKNFFIDGLTGNSYATDDDSFLGIESVWNNFNYFVNMQDCSRGCADTVYDLDDLHLWEPVLYGATSKKQLIRDVLKRKEAKEVEKEGEEEEVEKEELPPPRDFGMFTSWVSSISISKKDLETRWPGGQKATRYRKANLERFAPYVRPDGLATRLTTYRDLDCTEAVSVKESFQNRGDQLEQKEVSGADGSTTEHFRRGRRLQLLCESTSCSALVYCIVMRTRCFSFRSDLRQTDRECVMEFSDMRVDGLLRRVESSAEMTETFEGRKDFLRYRHVVFDQKNQLQIQKVVERFHRNGSTPANRDVAERVFLLAERRVEVTYHLEDFRFIPSKTSFIKPTESTEKEKAGLFGPDMASVFQVDPSKKPPHILPLYVMLQDLMKDEEKVILQIHESKKEVRGILACRRQEDTDIELVFSPWTTAGAARARLQRQERERLTAEEEKWLQEKEKDILAPFLQQLDGNKTLSGKDAKKLYQDCLEDFRKGLEKHCGLIQERYDKETQELQKEQQRYRKNQLTVTKEQEEEYQAYYAEKTFLIKVIKTRLNMHKKAAPQQLYHLDQKLKQDPRLSRHLL